jgi:hypothetical protein
MTSSDAMSLAGIDGVLGNVFSVFKVAVAYISLPVTHLYHKSNQESGHPESLRYCFDAWLISSLFFSNIVQSTLGAVGVCSSSASNTHRFRGFVDVLLAN